MDYGNGSQPQPNVIPKLLCRLQELLALQNKYQPNLTLPIEDNGSEVTIGIRDGSAHILRCLKVWYDLPTEVLLVSLNIMDRFLTKMKVQPIHIACISVASFHIACQMTCNPENVPERTHMITISQCKCTLSDLVRMESIIISKLEINLNDRDNLPVTALNFLRLFHEILCVMKYNDLYKKVVDQFQIFQRLEVIACNGLCVNYEASLIALVLLSSMVDIGVARLQPTPYAHVSVLSMVTFFTEIQENCQISDDCFYDCLESVLRIISKYDSQTGLPHRQRLVWRLSQRTLKYLRPTNKFNSMLPTIEEQCQYRTDDE